MFGLAERRTAAQWLVALRLHLHNGLLFLFLAANLPLAALYFKTAHSSSPAFQIFCVVQGICGAVVAAAFPGMRFFLAGFAIAAMPRLASLLLQAPLPNVLFPWFFGLAAGTALKRIANEPRESKQRFAPQAVVWAAALGVFVSCVRSVLVYYPRLLEQWALEDAVLAGHVTANFAVHLSLSLGLGLLAPLCWILAEMRGLQADKTAASISAGLAAGLFLGLVVLFLQGPLESLRAGVTDHGFEAGRRPGLLSDTGASNVLFPALCAVASLSIMLLFRGKETAGSVSPLRVALFMVPLLALTAAFQGKAVFLSILGIALFWRWMLPASRRWSISGTLTASALAAAVAAFAIHLRAPSIFDRLVSGGLNTQAALAAVDPVRAMLLDAFVSIFRESPWTGHALNGFIPRLMLLKVQRPELIPENPPGLVPGILVDAGILGLIFCAAVGAAAAALLRPVMARTQCLELRFLILLPVSLLPVFSVGYHILFAEIAAFCLLPLLFLGASAASEEKGGASPDVQ